MTVAMVMVIFKMINDCISYSDDCASVSNLSPVISHCIIHGNVMLYTDLTNYEASFSILQSLSREVVVFPAVAFHDHDALRGL